MIDKVKIVAALAIAFAGIYGYYQLPQYMGQDVSILLRVGLVLVALVASVGVAVSSEYGASFIGFAKGARTELRKMVWPSRQETIQTTIIVLVLVVLVAIFLWLIDMAVFEVIYDWLLGVDD
jgi:preprotein translocase subunit SecE